MAPFILRLIINAAALWVAAYFVDAIELSTEPASLFIVALIFGLVNALIKPIVALVTCPFYVVTLGLFTLVVNALMLMLTDALTGAAFSVQNFGWALVGGIIISIVSTILSLVLIDEK